VAEILVGTSGWSYDDWVGAFYPKAIERSSWLSFYAERFPTVEVNHTFYQMPSPERIEALAGRMADLDLEAVFKAPRTITHEAMPEGEERVAGQRLATFFDAMQPAAEAGRLDGLLVQFSHRAGPDTVLPGLEQALEQGPPARLFVEVRAPAFNEDRHYEPLRELVEPEGAVVAVDGPGATVTRAPPSEQAYFRFHGRNEEAWFAADPGGENASARYDDLYSEDEIVELADRIRQASAQRVRVFFNNHVGGKAPANARQLGDELGLEEHEDSLTLDDFT
jgi:uncharacterized protein YecE (DUF72 family)